MSKANRFKSWLRPKVLAAVVFVGFNFFLFQNCQQHGSIEMMVNKKSLFSSFSSSMILINQDAPYTRDINVSLQISAPSSNEMYITEASDCASGGIWEPLASEKPWVLSRENQNALVFVKFRSNIDISVESACISDSIVHDSIAPSLKALSSQKFYTNQFKNNMSVLAEDQGSGLDQILCKMPSSNEEQTCQQDISLQVTQDGSYVVQVAATDKAGNKSEPLLINAIVDTQKPTIAINSAPPLVIGDGNATFLFSATDNLGEAQIFCKVDEMPMGSCAADFFIKVGPGTHSLTVHSRDLAGNESDALHYQWLVDMLAPVVKITKAPSPFSNVARPSFEFMGTDNDIAISDFECKVDESVYAKCTSPFLTVALADGSHIFYLRGKDSGGNLSATVAYSWVVDTLPPSLAITEKPAPITASNVARFAMNILDLNPDGVYCALNNSSFVKCISPATFLLQGVEQSIEMYAMDKAGNKSAVTLYNWKVDTAGPVITFIKNPKSTLSITLPAAFEFSVRDELSAVKSVQCGLDGVLTDCAAPYIKTYSNLAVGSHTFAVQALDVLGNAGSTSYSFNVVNDTRQVIQTFTVNASTNKKADILIVIDNSKSMGTEQGNMAGRFAKFLEVIGGLDWRVGIVTTDVSGEDNLKNGRLIEMAGMPGKYFIDSTMDKAEATLAFAGTIQRSEQGSGDEQGLAATYKAISRSVGATSDVDLRNAQFFRSDAVLSVVIVSDADETPKDGVVGAVNIPENLQDLVSRTWQGKPFQWHSIVVPNGDIGCRDLIKGYNSDGRIVYENEDYGLAYEKLSDLTGGVKGTVCATDYGSQLTAIGQGVVNLVSKVGLLCEPLDINGDKKPDVIVKLEGAVSPPAYSVNGKILSFSSPLPNGTHTLEYSCLGVTTQ